MEEVRRGDKNIYCGSTMVISDNITSPVPRIARKSAHGAKNQSQTFIFSVVISSGRGAKARTKRAVRGELKKTSGRLCGRFLEVAVARLSVNGGRMQVSGRTPMTYVIRSLRSLPFLRPPKAILVPGMNFLGFSRYLNCNCERWLACADRPRRMGWSLPECSRPR